MTIQFVEQYFTVVLFFFFQFYPVCNSGKFINFGLGTVMSEHCSVPSELQFGIDTCSHAPGGGGPSVAWSETLPFLVLQITGTPMFEAFLRRIKSIHYTLPCVKWGLKFSAGLLLRIFNL